MASDRSSPPRSEMYPDNAGILICRICLWPAAVSTHNTSMIANQYRLLLHVHPEQTHWDLLLTCPGPAPQRWPTFSIPLPAQWKPGLNTIAGRLPDHRSVYWQYQGPVSQNRGYIQPLDAGRFFCRLWTCDRIIGQLQSNHCRAMLLLDRLTEQRWHCRIRR